MTSVCGLIFVLVVVFKLVVKNISSKESVPNVLKTMEGLLEQVYGV